MAIPLLPIAIDVVGIFDDNFNQLFTGARPLRAQLREIARAMEHPLETGQIITDYRIILPIEITIPVIISQQNYDDTYQEIRTAFVNSTIVVVRTRTGIYNNMVITEIPHEEDAEKYDAITMYLKFKQVQVVQANSDFAPADPTQADTQQIGQQNPVTFTPAAATQTQINQAFLSGGG